MGEFDVQWDTVHNLGLLYMHARHYAPTLGRFLQPDPDGSEDNLYAYAANSPVTAAPGSRPADMGSSPFEGIVRIANELFAPKTALAAYCASNPTFTGYLTTSTSSHPLAAGITDPDLYAWVSNVDSTWSCTAFYRFDGVAWNTTASAGRFDWGLLITSTSVACNYDVGSNDYIKGNATADCPDSDAEYALGITLTAE